MRKQQEENGGPDKNAPKLAPVGLNSAAWGGFMAVAGNVRYQVVNCVEDRVLVGHLGGCPNRKQLHKLGGPFRVQPTKRPEPLYVPGRKPGFWIPRALLSACGGWACMGLAWPADWRFMARVACSVPLLQSLS